MLDPIDGTTSFMVGRPIFGTLIALVVEGWPVLGVIDQRPRYVCLSDVRSNPEGELAIDSDTLPKDAAGERALGYSWDATVVWRGMPVLSPSGEQVGFVHDAGLDAETGALTSLRLSTGALGDAAVGRLEVPSALVRGFDGESVVVEAGYADIEATGGAAKVAASGVTAIKERTGQVADGMLEVGVAAAGALGRSLKSGMGRRALDKMKALMDDEE